MYQSIIRKPLSAHPYANAYVTIYDDIITLTSYSTTVAKIEGEWLEVYGLYSATTRKHIGAFVREFANTDYHLAKTICNQGLRYNIETGEVEPR